MTSTVIPLPDLQVHPAGAYAGTGWPAPRWGANYGDNPAYWGSRFLDPAIAAVGPHCGPSLLNVSGGPGVDVGLDAAVTNDGYADGPLVWLMPCLLVAGREVLRLAPEPLAFSDLYPDHLTGDGEVIASPDSTHANRAAFVAEIAPRVCEHLNLYFASRHETTLTVPHRKSTGEPPTCGPNATASDAKLRPGRAYNCGTCALTDTGASGRRLDTMVLVPLSVMTRSGGRVREPRASVSRCRSSRGPDAPR